MATILINNSSNNISANFSHDTLFEIVMIQIGSTWTLDTI
jgi:hypothetical protein